MTVRIKALIDDLEASNQQLRDEIVERKRMGEKYRAIFENAQEGIFQSTLQGRFLSANPALASILGYNSPRELLETITDIQHQLYVNAIERLLFLERLHADRRVSGFETQMLRKDGEPIWVVIKANAVCTEDGEIAYIEGLLEDVTERRTAQEKLELLNRHLEELVEERTENLLQKARELEIANIRLVELDKLKSSFFSTVSHDLRTPLTSILGFATLIRKEFDKSMLPLAMEQTQLIKKAHRISRNLHIIETEGARLTRLINDFLDFSKIESGNIEWRDTTVEILGIVTQAVNAVRGQFESKPWLNLHVDVDHVLSVHADPDRLMQVIVNLLNNAAKFTDHGSVTIHAAQTSIGTIRFCIADTGSGIPVDERSRIFDVFHQVHHRDTLSDTPKGSGLGLAICKEIIDHYQGRIWVESELGQGSRFYFELPAADT